MSTFERIQNTRGKGDEPMKRMCTMEEHKEEEPPPPGCTPPGGTRRQEVLAAGMRAEVRRRGKPPPGCTPLGNTRRRGGPGPGGVEEGRGGGLPRWRRAAAWSSFGLGGCVPAGCCVRVGCGQAVCVRCVRAGWVNRCDRFLSSRLDNGSGRFK